MARLVWQTLKQLFAPNQYLSRWGKIMLVVGQTFCALLFWCFSSSSFVPAFPKVLAAFGDLWANRGLSHELATSFLLIMESIFWMTTISLFLIYLTAMQFFRTIVKSLSALRFLSPVGLILLFTVFIHDGHKIKVDLLAFNMAVFFIPSILREIDLIQGQKYNLGRTLRMSEWRIVREVTIRGQLHKIIDAVQVNGAMGYMMLTMVEKVSRSEGGVGIMLQDMEKFLSMNQIWAIQLSLVLMGFVTIDVVGNLIKRRLSPQAFMKLERR